MVGLKNKVSYKADMISDRKNQSAKKKDIINKKS